MPTDHSIASLRGWTPLRFRPEEAGPPTVEWGELGEMRWNAPFFAQTVQAARAQGVRTRQTPASVLGEFADTAPELPLAGLVFHLSRCGSTLVSQMLAACPANAVLSEPEPLDELLRAARWPAPLPTEKRIEFVRGLVHAWGTRRFPEERRLVLKLDPWHVLDRDLIRAACPDVPWVFLYRDPVEILVSQSDNLAGTLFSEGNGPARLGITAAEVSRMSATEYAARALGHLAEAMANAAEDDPKIRLLTYSQLPGAVETIIAPHFGFTLAEADPERLRRSTHFHAKAPGRVVFREDSARKQRDADDEVRALAASWLEPTYRRLEALRLAGGR